MWSLTLLHRGMLFALHRGVRFKGEEGDGNEGITAKDEREIDTYASSM